MSVKIKVSYESPKELQEVLKRLAPMVQKYKTSKEYIGDVTDVTYEEGMYQVNMADGSFKPVAPEERYNVYVTVVFDGKTSNDGYYTKANKYLSTGTSLVFNTKYAQCESTVYSIGEAE